MGRLSNDIHSELNGSEFWNELTEEQRLRRLSELRDLFLDDPEALH